MKVLECDEFCLGAAFPRLRLHSYCVFNNYLSATWFSLAAWSTRRAGSAIVKFVLLTFRGGTELEAVAVEPAGFIRTPGKAGTLCRTIHLPVLLERKW